MPHNQLMDTAREMAAQNAQNAPLTVQGHLQVVRFATEMGVTAAEDAADVVFGPIYRSQDAQEGPSAFGEKRPPQWKGR